MALVGLVAVAVFGLVVGSFLNVVVHRLPRGQSLVAPGSACPACGHSLAWWENVPVASWLALRARCRRCRAPIAARYPLVELLTAALWVAAALRFGADPALGAFLVLFAVLVAVTAIDLEHRRIPTPLVYAGVAGSGLALVVAAAAAGEPGRLGRAVLGGLLGFGALFAVHLASPRGMGFGDVRLAGLLGLDLGWLGLGHVALGIFLGFLLGAVVGIGLLASGRAGRKTAVPFGPFLAAGTVVAVLVGQPLLDRWYAPLARGVPAAPSPSPVTPVGTVNS